MSQEKNERFLDHIEEVELAMDRLAGCAENVLNHTAHARFIFIASKIMDHLSSLKKLETTP
jgi:hypothetical protein